ncbi:hypothetical protein [Streptomyces sp. NPDC001165]|uniref:hypothetical protein n=1 Tax=Streptomyces sp. NPDC001165 TaxID=3364546 RepID=UPI0036AFB4AB
MSPRPRVDRISLGAHRRVQRELERVQDVLDPVVPDPSCTGGAVVVPGCLVGVEGPDELGMLEFRTFSDRVRAHP